MEISESMKKPLFEGQLVIDPQDPITRGQKQYFDIESHDLPEVTIGKPLIWPLSELNKENDVDNLIKDNLKANEFFLTRFAFSFRSRNHQVKIESARFNVYLIPASGHQARAYSMHPMEVTQEIRKNVKVGINPTLKFSEVEGSLGNIDFGIEYPELQPKIIASGVQETVLTWDYFQTRGTSIMGSKIMHAWLIISKNAKVRASISLDAELRMEQNIIHLLLGSKEGVVKDALSVRLI